MKNNILIIIAILISSISISQERHFKNLRKLTFGGDNAEAYFSPDGSMLTLQVTNKAFGVPCDQIYTLDLTEENLSQASLKRISNGLGRTTCSFFMPDGKHILYASTHKGGESCPAPPKSKDGRYIWAVYPEYNIFIADLEGNIVKQLTDSEGYDAEAVVSPDGKKIAFTSIRSGDLELYVMDVDGSNLVQITDQLGYDGGAFFSHDSQKLVFRSSRPKTPEEIADYKALLAENLVAPTEMEIYVCNVDGSELRQVTNLGKANWSPYFHPSDKKILFSSNHHSTHGYDFQIFMIDIDGTNLKQITYESEFNAFPMFSPDGKRLVFSSNRINEKPKDTNVFIADWVDADEEEYAQENLLKQHIEFLASEELQGRMTGSEGEAKAASYIEDAFKKFGLKPYNENSYFQEFTYRVPTNPSVSNELTTNTGKNVIGFLDNNASKTIVIGAHYDHIGLNDRDQSSRNKNFGQIHYGADDNASGVALVLEMARMLTQNQRVEDANYVFACFSGEEEGLIGSKVLANDIKNKYPNIVSMINLDMVGRLNNMKELTVGGIGTSPVFKEIIEKNKPAGFNVTIDESGMGPSDHASFYMQDISVLYYFTGLHKDYHQPTDTADKINYTGLKIITDYVFNTTYALEQLDSIPFVKTANQSMKTAPRYKVSLGVMPDYTDHGDGLHVDSVLDNRPAEKAGIKAGDIIIKIGDCDIKEVYGYMDCLSELNAGDVKPIKVVRDGIILTFNVEF